MMVGLMVDTSSVYIMVTAWISFYVSFIFGIYIIYWTFGQSLKQLSDLGYNTDNCAKQYTYHNYH